MQYTSLGRTGLKVSRLCLGTMNFGPFTPENESHALMDHAHALGINFFDTADVYGRVKGEGVTEQIIGRWFASGGQRREKTVIATKVYGEMGEWPNTSVRSTTSSSFAQTRLKYCRRSSNITGSLTPILRRSLPITSRARQAVT